MRHGEDLAVRSPSTPIAIDALRALGHLDPHDADTLADAYELLRDAEIALKLLDEHREPMLEPDGRSGTHVARMLQIHARDAMSPAEALAQSYRRRAEATRDLFEAVVAPVDAPSPWERGA